LIVLAACRGEISNESRAVPLADVAREVRFFRLNTLAAR